jgi:hypothetical protein
MTLRAGWNRHKIWHAINCNRGSEMSRSTLKISLRGSLANDIARLYLSGAADPSNILGDMLRSNPDDLIYIPDGGLLKVGKKSEVGKFPPDW